MDDETRFLDLLQSNFSDYQKLRDGEGDRLFKHYELLVKWNRVLNLTSIHKVEEIVLRHYCESLFLTIHLPEAPGSALDFGSGAGFPGIPLAILRPDWSIVLAESHRRKAVFLREATRELPNVKVVPDRAEQVRDDFTWVVSRAVRWPDVLKIVGKSCALLLGEADARIVTGHPGMRWREPITLPWGNRRVLVMGERTGS